MLDTLNGGWAPVRIGGEAMSGGTSSSRRITRRRYQTDRLGRQDATHALLPVAKAVNRIAARFGLPFLGWDERAGSLSWQAPPGLPNGRQVALKA